MYEKNLATKAQRHEGPQSFFLCGLVTWYFVARQDAYSLINNYYHATCCDAGAFQGRKVIKYPILLKAGTMLCPATASGRVKQIRVRERKKL
jgi:hypothetical protein